jgi:hypothetical protein
MFPDDMRQIVNSRVVKVGNDYRIESAGKITTYTSTKSSGWRPKTRGYCLKAFGELCR